MCCSLYTGVRHLSSFRPTVSFIRFVDLEGKVQEGNKIDCEQEVKDCDKADPQTCEWKYRINTKGKVLAQEEWKAVCRQKSECYDHLCDECDYIDDHRTLFSLPNV